jgi:hypothetical protein
MDRTRLALSDAGFKGALIVPILLRLTTSPSGLAIPNWQATVMANKHGFDH